jgi:HAD superfamily hydrolase (TIGR01490 family)
MPAHVAKPAVALFDMDRTLVNIHTARLYLKYQRDIGEVDWVDALRASYWLFEYSLGIANADRIAQRVLRDYRGKAATWMSERFQNWFKAYVLPCVSEAGRERVQQHRDHGHAVAIATSAIRFAAQPLAAELSIPHLICSELEIVEGSITGEFAPPLCYGGGKRERSEALLASLGYGLADTAFYTDSITDLPLLEAVGYPVVVNPDTRLRRVAKRRGWPIEDWVTAPVPEAAEHAAAHGTK